MKNKLVKRIGALLCAMAVTFAGAACFTAVQGTENVSGAQQTPGNATQTPGNATQTPGDATQKQPVNVPVSGVKDAAELAEITVDAIETAEKGTPVSVTNVPKDMAVSKNVFEAAKKKDVKLTITSTAGSYVGWEFQNLNTLDKMGKEFNPMVTVGKSLKAMDDKLAAAKVTAKAYTQVSFAYDGILPGTAKVTLRLDDSQFKQGQEVYLYYFDPKEKLFELTSTARNEVNGATFTMTHCSDYIVTGEKLPEALIKKAPSTGEGYLAVYGMTLVLCAVAAGVLVIRKKREA